MTCSHCGASYPPDSKFCPCCGTQLTTVEKEILLPQPMTLPLFTPMPPAAPVRQPPAVRPVPVKQGSLGVPIAILAVLCVVGLILFALFPSDSSSAPAITEAPTSCFLIDDGRLYFYEDLYSGPPELTIPETVNGKIVDCIGTYAFFNCDQLTTVFLPDTLKAIDAWAFSSCHSLRGISIPEGVESIGSSAFADCDALEAITIPSTVEYLADDAFSACHKLRYVFFAGTTEEWMDLFDGNLHPKATVYCSDGEV